MEELEVVGGNGYSSEKEGDEWVGIPVMRSCQRCDSCGRPKTCDSSSINHKGSCFDSVPTSFRDLFPIKHIHDVIDHRPHRLSSQNIINPISSRPKLFGSAQIHVTIAIVTVLYIGCPRQML